MLYRNVCRNLLFSTLASIPMQQHFKRRGFPVPTDKEEELEMAIAAAATVAVVHARRIRHRSRYLFHTWPALRPDCKVNPSAAPFQCCTLHPSGAWLPPT